MRRCHTHPLVVQHMDRLLVSINDRLSGKPGEDIELLDNAWIDDIITLESAKITSEKENESLSITSFDPMDMQEWL